MNSLALVGGLQLPELIVIMVVVLIIFGPKALPKLARAVGQSVREFKDATNKMTDQIMKEEESDTVVRPRTAVDGVANRPTVAAPAAREAEPSKPSNT